MTERLFIVAIDHNGAPLDRVAMVTGWLAWEIACRLVRNGHRVVVRERGAMPFIAFCGEG